MIRATGQLYHKFHGTYWCIVGLFFDSPEDARCALPKLDGFEPSEKDMAVLCKTEIGRRDGQSEDEETGVDMLKKQIEAFRVYPDGASREPIDSCDRSIDWGPKFHVEIPE